MLVRVAALPELYRPEPGARPVVIDVLRFTTCVAAALQAGAEAILPCSTPEEALGGRRPGDLVAGERQSLPLPGFDLGNSPREFTPERVGGRTVRATTTNGTRALGLAGAGLCAALVNRAAVAAWLAREEGPVWLVCSGNGGAFAAEDWLAAGALVAGLRERGVPVEADDAARAAEAWFRACPPGALAGVLAACDHGRSLVRKGLGDDLEVCAALDAWDVVPAFRDGEIRALRVRA